jgi:hypothetical protein
MMTTPTTSGPPRASGFATVTAFLDAVASGRGIPVELYSDDAVVDATVPNWRMGAQGPDAIARLYGGWFAVPGSFEQLRREPLPDGELVVYLLTWSERGVPHAAHHCHVITLGDDDRIVADTVFCGGRWPASLLAEMAAST